MVRLKIMKKTNQILISFLAVFLFAHVSFAQETKANVDGFWGMKFGSSVAECRKIILSKNTGTIDAKNSSETKIIIDNPEFAGKKPAFIALLFVNDKFHTSKTFFKPTSAARVFELYDSIKGELNDKYYKTKEDFKIFKSPYYDGDGYEASAIRLGKATVAAFWTFNQSDESKTVISLQIEESLLVNLSYQDDKIADQAIEKQKNKNAKDY